MLEDKEQIREKENHRVFKQLLNTFIQNEQILEKNEEITEYAQNIKIVPKIYYDDFSKKMKAEFKIGDKQFYKIKDLPEFYTKMLQKQPYQYGTKSNLINKKESFIDESLPILDFVLKYAEIMKYSNEAADNYTYYKKSYAPDHIFISNRGLDDLFDALRKTEVVFQRAGAEKQIYFSSKEPDISFNITQITEDKFQFEANIDIFSYDILEGKEYLYLLLQDKLYRCSKEFEETTLKILEVLRKNYTNQIIMNQNELTNFFAIVSPNLQESIQHENLSEDIAKKCIPKKLSVKIYLDYDPNNYITADIRFCYEEIEFNPLINEKNLIARNMMKENLVLNQFIKTGFMLDKINARLILSKEDAIYHFLSEEIEEYMKHYEILATDSFKKREIRGFQINNLGIRIENNLLEIDLSQVGIDLTDLAQMLEKYKLKKKFHRLKDGSYLNLEENETMQFLEEITTNMELEPKDLEKGVLTLPIYRSLYLEKMLRSLKNIEIKKDNSYQKMVNQLENNQSNSDIILPKDLNAQLRNYQKVGYQWLKTLDEYHFGGILADDMGLRKNSTSISNDIIICK